MANTRKRTRKTTASVDYLKDCKAQLPGNSSRFEGCPMATSHSSHTKVTQTPTNDVSTPNI